MNIFVDIDRTICDSPDTTDYTKSTPRPDAINKVNDLYKDGHNIVYWTARGAKTGIDWRALTMEQLSQWGCLYHELRFDKPDFDLLIDDKAENPRTYFPRIWKPADELSHS